LVPVTPAAPSTPSGQNQATPVAATTLPAQAEANQPATTEVVASGIGADGDKALKDARRNAVQQAVGAIVDAETLVKNEDVIKGQILTYSDGYVEKFDKFKEGKRDDGLVEVKIKALIKRRELVDKLKSSKVLAVKVDGQSLFGALTTQIDAAFLCRPNRLRVVHQPAAEEWEAGAEDHADVILIHSTG
jgi:hypothetical protein